MIASRTFKRISNLFHILVVTIMLFYLPGWGTVPVSAVPEQCYVNASAVGANTGLSWTDAFTDLQSALGESACTEVWVAMGTYKPTSTTERKVTFQLKNGVAIYGGFIGTENFRSQRKPAENLTVLSGDIDNNDSQVPVITDLTTVTGNTTNSYQVLKGSDGATLDGFTITAGYADGDSGTGDNSGGGMYNMYACPRLENLNFSGNHATNGGALYVYANYDPYSPVLTNISFQNNSAAFYGGGMYMTNQSTGTPALTKVTFKDNTGKMGGGGLYNSSSNTLLANVSFSGNDSDYGGGMYNNDSDPSMTDVTFSGNQANGYGGGLYNQFGDIVMTRVTFDGNSAVGDGYGGGMHNYHSNVTMVNVTFNENTAVYGGGMTDYNKSTPTMTNVLFTNNKASQDGGGLYDQDSNPILTTALFSGNTAGNNGGGIFDSASSPALTDVLFNGNSAQNSGGGMFTNGGSPVLAKVTFKDNTSVTEGGGMAFHYASSGATLTNVTFSGNTAGNEENAGIGGGMLIKAGSSGSPALTNVTISSNSATSAGGGVYAMNSAAPAIKNTILWGNTAFLAGSQVFNNTGAASTLEDSVVFADCPIGSTCTNIITVDPLLGALGEYGGFTPTVPLLEGSSAIDQGNELACPATDQRGAARLEDAKCDIGAYEYGVFLPTISGNAGAAYVTLTYDGGTFTSSWLGDYKFSLPSGWSGTVTPSKPGFTFTPDHRDYTDLTVNMPAQDYTAAPFVPILIFLPLVLR